MVLGLGSNLANQLKTIVSLLKQFFEQIEHERTKRRSRLSCYSPVK